MTYPFLFCSDILDVSIFLSLWIIVNQIPTQGVTGWVYFWDKITVYYKCITIYQQGSKGMCCISFHINVSPWINEHINERETRNKLRQIKAVI